MAQEKKDAVTKKEMLALSEACGVNSLTLTALINVLLDKKLISREDLIKAFDEARVSQSTNVKRMKDELTE